MKQILILLTLTTVLSSCKLVKGLVVMNKETAKTYSYNIHNKNIVFIPMHHIGKKKFYDDVKQTVISLKQNGYVVYYEFVADNPNLDSLQLDVMKRKMRKIKGFSGSYGDAVNVLSSNEKYIQQPKYPELGTTNEDINADVNLEQFVNEWEKQYGVIVLDSIDQFTPLNEAASINKISTPKQFHYIAVEYRNEYLSNHIKTSNDSKIVIMYGGGHRKDLIRRLNRKTI